MVKLKENEYFLPLNTEYFLFANISKYNFKKAMLDEVWNVYIFLKEVHSLITNAFKQNKLVLYVQTPMLVAVFIWLVCCFYQFNFFLRQFVKLVDDLVYLIFCKRNSVLQLLFFIC